MFRNIRYFRYFSFCFLLCIVIYFLSIKITTYQLLSKPIFLKRDNIFYIWCTFTRVQKNDYKFKNKLFNFVSSLKINTDVNLSLNVIVDQGSRHLAKDIIANVINNETRSEIQISYHDIGPIIIKLEELINTMKSFFTPGNHTYYGNALFYISLGLHQIVPPMHHKVILMDIDMEVRAPISELFEHFYKFKSEMLFGLAPELSPVYFHNLQKYRKKYPESKLGLSGIDNGNQGYNSGVVLLNIDKLRHSHIYTNVTRKSYVHDLTSKYSFIGHLGDQDFYTLLSFEHPELFYTLPCQWNRSLCQWWRYHGYRNIFKKYFQCEGQIFIYHGNCNTPIDTIV